MRKNTTDRHRNQRDLFELHVFQSLPLCQSSPQELFLSNRRVYMDEHEHTQLQYCTTACGPQSTDGNVH